MKDVVIVSAGRTAVGKFGGSLSHLDPIELGALVIPEVIKRAGLKPADIQRVIYGENIQINFGGNPARRVHLKTEIPIEADDYTINMNCSSGLMAVLSGAKDIMLGEVDTVLAGGMESMSSTPYLLEKARFGYRLGGGDLVDFLADYILGDAGPMAENVAEKYHVSRDEQDEYANRSQLRAAAAQEAGKFKDEIIPVEVKKRRDSFVFDTDEGVRADSTVEKLAKLRPVFKKDGTVTAGNASTINDGAAAVVVMSAERAAELGLKPLARIKGWASAGVAADLFGIGPVPATRKVLEKTGIGLDEIDVIELNEAFASSTIACIRELGMDEEKVNVNGGAISLGHPVGATGIILTIKAINEMKRRGSNYGLVTMCIGSGQGISVILENLES